MTEEEKLKVFDKRHWVNPDENEKGKEEEADLKRLPTYVAKLEDQVAKNDEKLKEYITAYKEKMAENDRFRARLEKDLDRRVEAKLADFFRMVLPELDNLQLACDSAKRTADGAKIAEGLGLVMSGFSRSFSEMGLKEIDCMGKPFDPKLMEALRVLKVDETEKDNTVVEMVQAGYMMGEMLVRPAKVSIGRTAP